MKDLHKYFYSIVAGCLIALGTGFLSISQYTIDIGKEARNLEFQLEENENVNFDVIKDCNNLQKEKANCNYIMFLDKSNAQYMSFSGMIGNILLYVSAFAFCVGVLFHIKQLRS